MEKSTVIYGDGNGNMTIIHKKQDLLFEYKPIKPENSSSGIYDGGEPVIKRMTEVEYEHILSAIRKAVENKSVHIENRVKMSGFIKITNLSGEISLILQPGCPEQQAIEKVLKAMRLSTL